MKNLLILSALAIIALAAHAQAQTIDRIGGAGGDSAQTMHHCGTLPARGSDYATSPLTVRIIQKKLQALGHYRAGIDGKFGPASRAAVQAFQTDYHLPVTGRVDGETASHLAYATHTAVNVQRCYRTASNFWRAY